MSDLVPWRAVLAPLGVRSPDGRTLSPQIKINAFPPLPFYLQDGEPPYPLIGRVDMVSVDAAQAALVAAGMVDPAARYDNHRNVVDVLRDGELGPSLYVDTVTMQDGEIVTARVVHVLAMPTSLVLWPGRARFDSDPTLFG